MQATSEKLGLKVYHPQPNCQEKGRECKPPPRHGPSVSHLCPSFYLEMLKFYETKSDDIVRTFLCPVCVQNCLFWSSLNHIFLFVPTDKGHCPDRKGEHLSGVFAVNQLVFPWIILLALGSGGRGHALHFHIGHQRPLEISQLTKEELSTKDPNPEVPSLNPPP